MAKDSSLGLAACVFLAVALSTTALILVAVHGENHSSSSKKHGKHDDSSEASELEEAAISALQQSVVQTRLELEAEIETVRSSGRAGHINADALKQALKRLRDRDEALESQVEELAERIAGSSANAASSACTTPCNPDQPGVPGCLCQLGQANDAQDDRLDAVELKNAEQDDRLDAVEETNDEQNDRLDALEECDGSPGCRTVEEMLRRVLVTSWNLQHNGPVYSYVEVIGKTVSPETVYAFVTDFFTAVYDERYERLPKNMLSEVQYYYGRLDEHDNDISEMLARPDLSDVDKYSLRKMRALIHLMLVYRTSAAGWAKYPYYPGFFGIFLSSGVCNRRIPHLGDCEANLPTDADISSFEGESGVGNWLVKPLIEWNTQDYRNTLAYYQTALNLAVTEFGNFEAGVALSYRPLWEVTTFAFYDWNETVNRVWTDLPISELVPVDSEQTDLFVQIETAFGALQRQRQKTLDLLYSFRYVAGPTSALRTLGQAFPSLYPPGSPRANESVIRSGVLEYNRQLAGIQSMYPTPAEASKDYELGWRMYLDENTGIMEAMRLAYEIVIASWTNVSPEVLAANSFSSDFYGLSIPGHRPFESNVLLGDGSSNPNHESIITDDMLTYGKLSYMGLARVESLVGGLLQTRDPHRMVVGDTFFVQANAGDSDLPAYNAYTPVSMTGGCIRFNATPPFAVNDRVEVIDYGIGRGSTSITLGNTFINEVITNSSQLWTDMRTTNFVMFPESASFRAPRWRHYLVTNTTMLSGLPAVCMSGFPTATRSLLAPAGYLVRARFAQTPFLVTAVLDPYRVQTNTTVTFAGSTVAGLKMTTRGTWYTAIRRKYTSVLSLHARNFADMNLVFSDSIVARYTERQNLGRHGFTIVSGAGGAFEGNGSYNTGVRTNVPPLYTSTIETMHHEMFGHILQRDVALLADFSNTPDLAAAFAIDAGFFEGYAIFIEEAINILYYDVFYRPQRTILSFEPSRIWYNAPSGNGELNSAFIVGEEIQLFSFTNGSRNHLRDVRNVQFRSPTDDYLSQVYRITAEGCANATTCWLDVVNGVTNGPAGFVSGPYGHPDPAFLVSLEMSVYMHGAVDAAFAQGNTFLSVYQDGQINFLNTSIPALTAQGFAVSEARLYQRITVNPIQNSQYSWGYLKLLNAMNNVLDSLNITRTQFFFDGYVRGFLDALLLDGITDFPSRLERVNDYIGWVLGGGDPTKYPVGQENAPLSLAHHRAPHPLGLLLYNRPVFASDDQTE